MLLDPLKKSIDWIKGYARVFYFVMFPLLLMLLVAVFKRIEAYGITEKRYALVSLGMLLMSLILYFLFSRSKNIKVVPMALSGLLTLTLFGPWSAYNVSRNSQMAEVEALLLKHNLLEDGGAVPGSGIEIDSDDARRITNILEYLVENHEAEYLEVWFPKEVLEDVWYDSYVDSSYRGRYNKNSRALMNYMGVAYTTRYNSNSWQTIYFSTIHGYDVFELIPGYTHLIHFQTYSSGLRSHTVNGTEYLAGFVGESQNVLTLKVDERSYEIDLNAVVRQLLEYPRDQRSSIPASEIDIDLSDLCSCKFSLKSMDVRQKGSEFEVSSLRFLLYVKALNASKTPKSD